MIPKEKSDGLLPPGIYDATLKEVEKRFVFNPQRQKIYDGFLRAIEKLKLCGCACVYLDGSFITTKQIPSDFDACWEVSGVDLFNLKVIEPVLLDFSNQRAGQKAKFYGEFFPADAKATKKSKTQFLDFFQSDKETGKDKGIIKIKL